MRTVLKLAALVAPIIAAAPAHAATIGYDGANGGFSALTIDGEIIPGDMQRLENAYAALSPAQRKKIMSIDLNSPGGNVVESIKIAAFVHSHKLWTMVGAGDGKMKVCASACFYIFAQGFIRGVVLPAAIGVHSVSIDGAETSESARVTLAVMRLLALDGKVPDAILGKMALAPPGAMIWLTADDLRTMHVPIVTPCKTKQCEEDERAETKRLLDAAEKSGLFK
jgi:hypothetical protein